MTKKLSDLQDVFLGKVNQICNRFGLNNIMAQLYALLYLNSKTMSLDEIVQALNISKASASINLRALEGYGAVRRVWVKGSRKDYYEAEMNISKVMMDRVKSMAQGRLSEIDDMIKSSYKVIDSITPSCKEEKDSIARYKEQLDKLNRIYNQVQALYGMFNSGILGGMLNAGAKLPFRSRKSKKEKVA